MKIRFIAGGVLALMMTIGVWADSFMGVHVRSARMRNAPSFLGGVVSFLTYGTQVKVIGSKDLWLKVEAEGKSGWLHQSALVRKKILLAPGSEDVTVGASDEEVALAGKGFNSEIEAEHKSRHQDLDFKWVDRMEKVNIAPAVIRSFNHQGGLGEKKGTGP